MLHINSTVIKGHGRGKGLGFPTINLVIPRNVPMSLPQGIFAGKATVNKETYNAAIYFGPAVTFGEHENQLEVYLLDAVLVSVSPGDEVVLEVIQFVRHPETFTSPELLIQKMNEDITNIHAILAHHEHTR